MVDRRARAVDGGGLRPGPDQAVEVAALELVGVARQRLEVADPVVAGAGPEQVVEGQRAERGVAAGAAAGDGETARVGPALGDQEARGVHAVQDVDLAPAPLEALAVGAPVAGAAAVVDVAHRKAARGPELVAEGQLARGAAGRPAVALDDQRRALPGGRLVIGVGRRVVEGVGGPARLARELDRLRRGEVGGIDRQVAGARELAHRSARGRLRYSSTQLATSSMRAGPRRHWRVRPSFRLSTNRASSSTRTCFIRPGARSRADAPARTSRPVRGSVARGSGAGSGRRSRRACDRGAYA